MRPMMHVRGWAALAAVACCCTSPGTGARGRQHRNTPPLTQHSYLKFQDAHELTAQTLAQTVAAMRAADRSGALSNAAH